MNADGGGKRFDEGKPRVDLAPFDAMMYKGMVYSHGAKKYHDPNIEHPDRNWERGMPWSKCIGPMCRHMFWFIMGEDKDPDSGLLHIAMVGWNADALLTYTLRGIGKDDRQKTMTPHLRATIERLFKQWKKKEEDTCGCWGCDAEQRNQGPVPITSHSCGRLEATK